jgi:hypothetical protein
MLADFSASSVAPLTSSGHSHESAMRELRSFGSHAGSISPQATV